MMNGIHDLGGMHGLGKIDHRLEEPVYAEVWEGRVHTMYLVLSAMGHLNLHEFRHGMERMNAAHYLSSSYYEHWLDSLERILGEKGLVSAIELEGRVAQLRGQVA
jgi:nitrile hydratase subunit beta